MTFLVITHSDGGERIKIDPSQILNYTVNSGDEIQLVDENGNPVSGQTLL